MEKDYPIKIVQGNYFAIALPLSKIVWSSGSKTEQPLVPNKGDLITVNLVSSSRRYDMRKIYVEDNVVHYECNEYLDLGTYSIELRLILVDGKKYRSYQRNKIQIVATNEEADIKDGNEFDVDTYEISSAVILYAKGDKGDQGDRGPTGPRGPVGPAGPRGFRGEDGQDGLSAYEIAVEQGFVGTEEEWLLSLKGDKGEDGTTDYNELENTPTFKTINGETITGEGDIVIEGGGSSGEDGVGIDSITTVESPDDGGNNVVTIHLTDGTQSSFNVKNGHKGSDGAQGPQGQQGPQGAQGEKGETGEQGPQGPAGQNGTNGTNGADGSDGKSAYEIAVENGFVGDETAWLASLKGEQGIQGPQGQTGPQGPAGTSGLYPLQTQTALTVQIAPNTFNVWSEPISNDLTITLGAEVSGVMNEYLMQFSIASGVTPQVTFPSNLQWTGIDTFQGGKTYQVSIVNGYAIGVEFDTITS